MVEGDAVAVARRAAGRLGGRVTVHERFGTATVEAPDATFDLAGARRERYERPGALPDVELGASLRDDLARRDFTVNAIALHLADGELIWYPQAEDDLRAGARCGCCTTARSGTTRRACCGSCATAPGSGSSRRRARTSSPRRPSRTARWTPSPARGSAPSCGCCCASRSPTALAALERHGIGAAVLGPRFAVDADRVTRAIALTPPDDADPGLAALAATLVGDDAVAATLDRLGFPAGERDTVAAAAGHAEPLARALNEASGDAGLWRALRRHGPESVAVAAATGGDQAAARRWLADVRHRRLAITGDDFVAAGLSGPPVGAALDAATEAMLDGRAPTPEAQLAAGLEAAGA